MRTMVRISNRDNSPIPSRMLEHRGADRAGLAIAVWHRNVRIAEIEGRDRDRIRAGIATAPEPKRKGAAAPGRSGPCVTTRIAHPRYYRVARLMLDMVRSPYGKVFISSPMRRTARA